MEYGDNLSEPPLSTHVSEPETCTAITPRDSESYGSLHSDDQSEDGALDELKHADEFGQTRVTYMDEADSEKHSINAVEETNSRRKHTQTRFCVVL